MSVGKDKLDLPARLLNAVGKEVWQGMQTEVRTTGLPAGVYFLHTTVAGKTNITKVVIQ
ncbi:MAG: T9SS C-terminal target domain-containing protein [Bacteroidetes bacterium]|nr:MAG: T9SS C-terminal target domain-containing protein [Bacteroidota bacterium]